METPFCWLHGCQSSRSLPGIGALGARLARACRFPTRCVLGAFWGGWRLVVKTTRFSFGGLWGMSRFLQRRLAAFHVRTKRPRTPFVSVITRNLARLAAKKQAEQAFLSAEALALEQAQLAAAARLAEIRKKLET